MAIIQGEGLEHSEHPREAWTGGSHPGRLRFQTFRPSHSEPLTDALIGQGKMSVGGGGYGGGGLPFPDEVLHTVGGAIKTSAVPTPAVPTVLSADGSGDHEYALIAVSATGKRTAPSAAAKANGQAKLRWDSVEGADAYVVVRDGKEITEPIRLEGSQKEWVDRPKQ